MRCVRIYIKWLNVFFIIGKVDYVFVNIINFLIFILLYMYEKNYLFFILLKFDFKFNNDVKMGIMCLVFVSGGYEGVC